MREVYTLSPAAELVRSQEGLPVMSGLATPL